MTGEQAEQYIHSFDRFGSKLGLERITELLERLGDPQDHFKAVHVAGTNGKGSTSSMISSVLTEAGYKTGLFISPYILDFRERIQCCGRMISPEALGRVMNRVKPAVEQMKEEGNCPTEFEIVTAAAFEFYKDEECDIAVIEVGMGGRFDSTNVLKKPLASVITVIDYDHMDVLGDTLEKIAYEKCGIIKPGGTTISYPDQKEEALAVIMEQCALSNNRLIIPQSAAVKEIKSDIKGSRIKYGGMEITIPLAGKHQICNCLTAVETLFALREKGMDIPDNAIMRGIERVHFAARFEIVNDEPLVIIDGAHNHSGARSLKEALQLLKDRKKTAVCGMLRDKDYRSSFEELAPLFDRMICVTPNNPRALPAGELARTAAELCRTEAEIVSCEELDRAFELAVENTGAEDAIIVFGSLYLAADMRRIILDHYKNKTTE